MSGQTIRVTAPTVQTIRVTPAATTPIVRVTHTPQSITLKAGGPEGAPGIGATNAVTTAEATDIASGLLTAHIIDLTPHPDATSGRDFAAFYQNGIT